VCDRARRKRAPDPNKKRDVLLEGFECGGHFMEAAVHAAKHAVGFVDAVGIAFSSSYTSENLIPSSTLEMEGFGTCGGNGVNHIVPQHQVLNIFRGNHDPCRPVNPSRGRHRRNLRSLIDSADWLDVALLADRARHRNLLSNGNT